MSVRSIHPEGARPRGFTLIEALATIIALSAIAAALGPIVYAASDAYSGATRHRAASEQAAHAIDRIARTIREIPPDQPSGAPGIAALGTSVLAWTGGGAIHHDAAARRLVLTIPGHAPATLADGVDRFELRAMDAAGALIDPSAPGALTAVRRIEFAIGSHAIEHRAAVAIRAGLGAQ